MCRATPESLNYPTSVRQTGVATGLSAPRDKRWTCLRQTAIRVAGWPLFLVLGLLDAQSRAVYDEPDNYRLRASDSQGAVGQHRDRSVLILSRFSECIKLSATMTAQSVLYFVFLYFFSFFGLETLIFSFKQDMERVIAWATGSVHRLKDGAGIPLTMTGAWDPTLEVPYDPSTDFPSSSCQPDSTATVISSDTAAGQQRDAPLNAHLMAMCCKLMYEDDRIIRSVVEDRWGMEYHQGHRIPSYLFQDCWMPDLVWSAASNSKALIFMMKGADPIYQIDLRSDPPCSMAPLPGMGQVHCGLWEGLQQEDPGVGGASVLDTIVKFLETAGAGKEVYLCGHSLGGGLASIVALTLPQRAPALAQRVAGVYTFGAPRFGDAGCAEALAQAYGGRLFRYVHAADLVCKLPPAWGFAHAGRARFLASFPVRDSRGRLTRLLREEDDVKMLARRDAREDAWAYAYSAAKLALSPQAGETAMRTLARAGLLLFPGFSDHMPCDYERALRAELPRTF